MKSITTLLRTHPMRVAVVIALVAVAVFAGVRYAGGGDARAQGAPGTTTVAAATAPAAASSNTTAAGSGSCCATGSGAQTQASGSTSGSGSCCATSGSSAGSGASNSTAGAAQVTGNVQKISVDLSTGVYNPDVINLKAGVPAEITFGQSSGCTAIVQSQDLGFQADLSGGPQTVKLPALPPGTYGFACGMNMVRGEIVVK